MLIPMDDFTPDLRRRRADALTASVMQVISEYLCEHTEVQAHRAAAHDLFKVFYESGVEVINDNARAAAGLPSRGEKGWTADELRILEAKRLEALLQPHAPLKLKLRG